MSLNVCDSLAAAANSYREGKRLPSWSADPAVAKSAAATLTNSINEHHGRWLYELLQNAEDAGATKCSVEINAGWLVVSDDSPVGIPASAVESLSNPFTTTKSGGQHIGRKGIGFCSVYELTDQPVLWSNGAGIAFDRNKTLAWLRENPQLAALIEDGDDFPYLHALVPFGLGAPPEGLKPLGGTQRTRIGMPLKDGITYEKIEASISALDHRLLLTFRNLRSLIFGINGRTIDQIRVREVRPRAAHPSDADSIVRSVVRLQSGKKPLKQRFKTWRKPLVPSDSLLEQTIPSKQDRKRLSAVEISIVGQCDSKREVRKQKHPSKLFVYYPTEEAIPLGALIHGDFLLDGSRKHLTGYGEATFNRWMFERLADFLIEISNGLIRSGRFTDAMALLVVPDQGSTDDLDTFMPDFRSKISERLLLPAADGGHFALGSLAFLDPSLPAKLSALDLVDIAFRGSKRASDDLHCSGLRSFLKTYSARWIDYKSLTEKLRKPPKLVSLNDRIEWSKAAWKWIAGTLASQAPAVDVGDLKIIPTETSLLASSESTTMPYRIPDPKLVSELPAWLLIHALPKDFSDWLTVEEARVDSLTQLAEKVGVRPFSEAAVVEAFGQALLDKSYLQNPEQIGWEYLDFARSRGWPENPQLESFNWKTVKLGRLQIPAATSDGTRSWVSARDAYFGREWGNDDLPLLFSGNGQIKWASPEILDRWPEAGVFLETCEARHFPKLTSKAIPDAERSAFWSRVKSEIPRDHTGNYANPEGRCESQPKLLRFSDFRVEALGPEQASALLRLVRRGWATRYRVVAFQRAAYSYYSSRYDTVTPNVWFQQLRDSLTVPALRGSLTESSKLGNLWVRGAETPDWAWSLFPRLDGSRINPGDDFSKWVRESRLVRVKAEDIPLEEWRLDFFPAMEKRFSKSNGESDRDLATAASHLYRGFIETNRQTSVQGWTPPRACWNADHLRIAGPNESVWAVTSESDLHRWKELLPVFLFRRMELQSENFKSLGYRRLDDELTITLHGEELLPDGQSTAWLQRFIAWLYAIRRNEVSERPPLTSWRKLDVVVRQEVRVKLSVDGKTQEAVVPYHFDRSSEALVVSDRKWQDPRIQASAIVEALDLPDSLTARVEILIGLDEESRQARLIGEGFIESDLRGWRNEYLGNEDFPAPVAVNNAEPQDPIPIPIGIPAAAENPGIPHSALPDEADPIPLHGPEQEPIFAQPYPQVPPPSSPPSSAWSPRKPGAGGTRQPPPDALEVEKRSREIVERKLAELGYAVTQMTQENKGFDLEAKRNGEILLVEVKGNKDQASRVDLTVSEREVADRAGSSYRWQLWQVSRLAERSGDQPEIRIYDSIPPAALSPSGYQLDLSACKQIDPPYF